MSVIERMDESQGSAKGPLPGNCYTDRGLFAEEARRLFPSQPVLGGVAADFSQTGAFRTTEVADASVLLVRDQDGIVRAFANNCIHRGSRITEERAGHAARFVCPYHGWVYAPSGRLLAARGARSCDVTARSGLAPAVLDCLSGVYVHRSRRDEDSVRVSFARLIEPFALHTAVVAARRSFVVACNWKLWIENFLECWHCALNHPELGATEAHVRRFERADYEGYRADEQEWRSSAAAAGYSPPPSRELDPAQPVFAFWEAAPLNSGRRSPTPQGERLGEALGPPGLDGGCVFGAYGPFLHFTIAVDHATVHSFLPIDSERTYVETTWLARDRLDDVESLTWLWRATLSQDAALTERMQRSVRSPHYRGGVFLEHEQRSARFIAWWRNMMGDASQTGVPGCG